MYKRIDEEDKSIENRLLCLKVIESPNKCKGAYSVWNYDDLALNSGGGDASAIWEEGDYTHRVVATKTRYERYCSCECSCTGEYGECEEDCEEQCDHWYKVIEEVDYPSDDHDEWRIRTTKGNDRNNIEWGWIETSENKAIESLWDNVIENCGDDYICEEVAEVDGEYYSTSLADMVLSDWKREDPKTYAKAVESWDEEREAMKTSPKGADLHIQTITEIEEQIYAGDYEPHELRDLLRDAEESRRRLAAEAPQRLEEVRESFEYLYDTFDYIFDEICGYDWEWETTIDPDLYYIDPDLYEDE